MFSECCTNTFFIKIINNFPKTMITKTLLFNAKVDYIVRILKTNLKIYKNKIKDFLLK